MEQYNYLNKQKISKVYIRTRLSSTILQDTEFRGPRRPCNISITLKLLISPESITHFTVQLLSHFYQIHMHYALFQILKSLQWRVLHENSTQTSEPKPLMLCSSKLTLIFRNELSFATAYYT